MMRNEIMIAKLKKALDLANNIYSLDDILNMIRNGELQGHVVNDTWAITQVHTWPNRKSVDILFMVGDLEDSFLVGEKVERWAKSIGADMLTFTGRDGWWKFKTPEWKKVGVVYAKDI